MPKFLDAPQFYNSLGTLIDMGDTEASIAGRYYGATSSGVVGWQNNQFRLVNDTVPIGVSIYAPTLAGKANEFLYWTSNRTIDSKEITITEDVGNIGSSHDIYKNSIINDTVITITSGKYLHNVTMTHPASHTVMYISPYVTSDSTKISTFSSLLNSMRADGNNGYFLTTGKYNGNIVYAFGSTGLSGFIYSLKIS